MRKRTRLAVLAGVVLLVGVGVYVLWPGPDRITRENCDRLRFGMSRTQAYAILVLQSYLVVGRSRPAHAVVALAGSVLMSPPPFRPGQGLFGLRQPAPYQAQQQLAHLGHR
jgi:hypothetical protein